MTILKLPEDPRASKLLVQLDARYFLFVKTLPPNLQKLALLKRTFTGVQGEETFQGLSSMNPGLTCTPWMFWDLTRDLDDERFLRISEAGGLLVLASVLMDHLSDHQVEEPGEIQLLRQACFEAGTSILREEYHTSSEFWGYFDRLNSEHLEGLAEEIAARKAPEDYSFDRFIHMVRRKFSPIVVTMAAFCSALGKEEVLGPIETSIKDLAVASQLLDDLGDWKDDIGDRHLTYYLSILVPDDNWKAEEWPSVEELQQQIDDNWVDIKYLKIVIEWLDKSLTATQDLKFNSWNDYLNGYKVLAEEHLKRATAYHLYHVIDPLISSSES
jgi:hypothetical protein